MILPLFYAILSENTNVSLEVDANTLLWAVLTGMVLIIGFFVKNFMDRTSRSIERLDERVDKLEVGQAEILAYLRKVI